MKPINILKVLENQKKDSEKNRLNTTEEKQKIDKIYKFIDTYIMLRLQSLDVSKKILDELVSQAFEIIVYFDELTFEDISATEPIIRTKEVGFLNSTDTKIKKSVGNKIADFIIRRFTYEDKKRKYIEEYITPMLEKLNNDNIITYNLKEVDNKSKIANNRINKLVNKFIDDNAREYANIALFKGLYDEEYISKWDFIFSDNIQAKKDFKSILEEYIKSNINTIDFKNIETIDFAEITGAKIDRAE